LEISHDSSLFGRFWEPVAELVQWLAANSLFLRKQGIFLPEQGIFRQNRELSAGASTLPSGRRRRCLDDGKSARLDVAPNVLGRFQ
jgi:hypothetical protein